jgi:transposase
MYVCIMDQAGTVVLHRNYPTKRKTLAQVIEPYMEDLVVAVECVFTWYWIADLCAALDVPFVLGHALYMKAIHGAKSKNDKIDSQKIAAMVRGGMFPLAYAYPQKMRSTRDLLRRRTYLMHIHSELLAHIQNTNAQYNLPGFEKRIASAGNRTDLADHFQDPMVKVAIEVDVELLDILHHLILKIERQVLTQARVHDPVALQLLRTVPGVGKVLALVLLYEIQDIRRFPKEGNFISYARLVKCPHTSAGKKSGSSNNKIGNTHLKWAFSEAAALFLREHPAAQDYHQKQVSRYGNGKAMSLLAQKLGRVVYYMLKRKEVFDPNRFFSS